MVTVSRSATLGLHYMFFQATDVDEITYIKKVIREILICIVISLKIINITYLAQIAFR